jgi:oligopeptide/dipeptide ABC transporter ATP-binding protein
MSNTFDTAVPVKTAALLPTSPVDPGTGKQPALAVQDLRTVICRKSGDVPLVRGIDLHLYPGSMTVLLGESGSGKSITARSILRLTPKGMKVTGRAELGDTDMLALPERQLLRVRGARVALIPQDPSAALNPFRRVGAQIIEVLRVHGAAPSRSAARERALELLAQVGIPDPPRVFAAWPHELSGGMKQRIAIAISVSCRPDVLIADEPTTALDVTVQAQILRLLATLQREIGMAVLFITHDVGVANQIADEVAVMYAGVIVERGSAADVLNSPGHPYTSALLAALPTSDHRRGELVPIPGQPPSPADQTVTGCRFAMRCGHATEECGTVEPELHPVGSTTAGHAAACLRINEIAGSTR